MDTIICPIDGRPCEESCPDRYNDHPGGGCMLTTLIENSKTAVVIKPKEATV